MLARLFLIVYYEINPLETAHVHAGKKGEQGLCIVDYDNATSYFHVRNRSVLFLIKHKSVFSFIFCSFTFFFSISSNFLSHN